MSWSRTHRSQDEDSKVIKACAGISWYVDLLANTMDVDENIVERKVFCLSDFTFTCESKNNQLTDLHQNDAPSQEKCCRINDEISEKLAMGLISKLFIKSMLMEQPSVARNLLAGKRFMKDAVEEFVYAMHLLIKTH